MNQITKIFFVCSLIFFVALSNVAQRRIENLKPTVILISLDGFRCDYADRFKTPTLNRLAREGVRATRMIPSFPTITFPNHLEVNLEKKNRL